MPRRAGLRRTRLCAATHWAVSSRRLFHPARLGIRASRSGYRIALRHHRSTALAAQSRQQRASHRPAHHGASSFPGYRRGILRAELDSPRRSRQRRAIRSARIRKRFKTACRSGRAMGRPSAFTRQILRPVLLPRGALEIKITTIMIIHFRQNIFRLLAGLILIALAPGAPAQQQKERTLDEVKTEAIKRAENGMYPLIGLDPTDVREAFANIKTTDNDEWAAAFSAVADRYMAEGNSRLSTNPAQADKDFIRAWRLYSFGRWPVPASAGKKRAYAKALEAFLAHAKMMDPPLEVLHIPFEGSEIVGYLRLPKNAKAPVPMIIAINALDSP